MLVQTVAELLEDPALPEEITEMFGRKDLNIIFGISRRRLAADKYLSL